MNALHIVLTVIQVLAAVALVLVVLVQSGKSSGLSGVISGQSESFLSKNKSGSLDSKLSKATKWIAGVFIILTLVLNLL